MASWTSTRRRNWSRASVLPLAVLAVALVLVDPALLGGTALVLGTVFGIAYAYARYVEFDLEPDRERRGRRVNRREHRER